MTATTLLFVALDFFFMPTLPIILPFPVLHVSLMRLLCFTVLFCPVSLICFPFLPGSQSGLV